MCALLCLPKCECEEWRYCVSGCSTGWRKRIVCLKLHISFHERATNYRALWKQMIHEDEASYGSHYPVVDAVPLSPSPLASRSHSCLAPFVRSLPLFSRPRSPLSLSFLSRFLFSLGLIWHAVQVQVNCDTPGTRDSTFQRQRNCDSSLGLCVCWLMYFRQQPWSIGREGASLSWNCVLCAVKDVTIVK